MRVLSKSIHLAGLLLFWGISAQAATTPTPDTESSSDEGLEQLALQIERACPATADLTAVAERDSCGNQLAAITVLGTATINGSLRWGAAAQNDFNPAHNSLTLLNDLVWRKLYLSLFVFTGPHSIEVLPDESRLLRLGAQLRLLPHSEFPYPFWHSAAKWRSYQQTAQVGLLFKGGKLLAGYRNAQLDPNAPATPKSWNGVWSTDENHDGSPRTALYNYVLSADNPYVSQLDRAYKAMALEARKYQCAGCHNPANPVNMNPLVIFNLPSQALSGRHEIVYQLLHNEMPPGQGISDDRARNTMIHLARQFEKLGDEALQFEQLHKK